MKKILFLSMIAVSLVLASCGDDETNPIESGVFSKVFLDDTTTFTHTALGSGNYEYGLLFSVNTNGKVLKLGSRMPQAGSYRVTLWNLSDTTVAAQVTVTQAADVLTLASITPIQLTAGNNYFLSIWSSGQWYNVVKKGGGNIPYPITSGSLVIKGYAYAGTVKDPITFPIVTSNSYVAGLMDLEFQAD